MFAGSKQIKLHFGSNPWEAAIKTVPRHWVFTLQGLSSFLQLPILVTKGSGVFVTGMKCVHFYANGLSLEKSQIESSH